MWGLASWLDLWFVGVALETVNLYGCVVVATLAKIGVRCGNAVGGHAGLAIDAFLQKVFAGSHPPPLSVSSRWCLSSFMWLRRMKAGSSTH
jgi:hypothetical protein